MDQDTADVTQTDAPQARGGIDPEDVLEALRDVVDPELGINVVDLGLVYGLAIGEDGVATIDMTLTSAACPLTDVIEDQPVPRWKASCPTSGSTGCGCRRGARTRSPRTAGSSSAPSASTSERPPESRLAAFSSAPPHENASPPFRGGMAARFRTSAPRRSLRASSPGLAIRAPGTAQWPKPSPVPARESSGRIGPRYSSPPGGPGPAGRPPIGRARRARRPARAR